MIEVANKSKERLQRVSRILWDITNGTISKKQMETLLQSTLNKYQSEDSRRKKLAFAKAFLKYLTKTRLDNRYRAFKVFLEMPKTLKKRKNITSRIITKNDIQNILTFVKKIRIK